MPPAGAPRMTLRRPLLALPLVALVLAAGPAARAQTSGSNGFYDVTVSAVGEYTAATGPAHPNPGLNVFYGGFIPLTGTTWNTVRSYDSLREMVIRTNPSGASAGFTCSPIASIAGGPIVTPILDGAGTRTGTRHEWTVDDRDDQLTITQEVNAEGDSYESSVVRVTLCVRNDATRNASVGVRFLWDWQMSGLDGPFIGLRPPHPPSEPFLSREQDFTSPTQDFYDVSNTERPSVDPPFYKVGGTITGPPQSMGPIPPDLLQYVSWPNAKDRCFAYSTTGAIVGATAGTDSAVAYTWGPTPATAILLAPGETWCATQYAFAFVDDPPPLCEITARVFGGVNCGLPETTLDASPSSSTDCAGALEYRFTDPSGRMARDWSTDPVATVTVEGEWTIEARCAADPSCFTSATAEVILEQPPRLFAGTVTDVMPCNLGLEIAWNAAEWADTAGGTYDVHRSEISCDDALAQPAMRSGLDWGTITDVTTGADRAYFYAIVAESATPARACAPVGPRGGATATLCLGPVVERADPTPPAPPCWTLRVSRSGPATKLDWTRARPLHGGEHVHVLKAWGRADGGFTLASPEGLVAATWSEVDASSPLQFFDVRFANACEVESVDDEPPGRDPPSGVPCP